MLVNCMLSVCKLKKRLICYDRCGVPGVRAEGRGVQLGGGVDAVEAGGRCSWNAYRPSLSSRRVECGDSLRLFCYERCGAAVSLGNHVDACETCTGSGEGSSCIRDALLQQQYCSSIQSIPLSVRKLALSCVRQAAQSVTKAIRLQGKRLEGKRL